MALAPINAAVDAINDSVIILEGIETKQFLVSSIFMEWFQFSDRFNARLKAEDLNVRASKRKKADKNRAKKRKKTKISETGGLADVVVLGPRMRVMLKRNLSVQNGLG